jgi:hypothetical protein
VTRAVQLLLLVLAAGLLAAGCDDGRRYDQAVAVLVDVSGTYADQKPEVVRIVKSEVLPALEPGDTLLIVRIDSESYEKDNLEALVTLDARPSRANAQKLALARQLDAFAASDARSEFTDIPGAMMLAADYLRELAAPSRVMLVFSDLDDDLPSGTRRELAPDEFAGIRVVAVNVKRLDQDNADPARFRARLARWEGQARRAGAADWKNFMDSAQVPMFLAQAR